MVRRLIVTAAASGILASAVVWTTNGGAAPVTYRTVGAKTGAGVGFLSTGKVSCPAGFHMVGGGYYASGAVRVVASWPADDRTWAVRGSSADGSPHIYYIYVRCRT
jgi:hypothetical protein